MAETKIDFHDFHWLDISAPTLEGLELMAKTYELHPTSVQDCLQPEHLPKHETIYDVSFIVLRAFDQDCHDAADTVQELTRKIAIFYSERFVITVHRMELPFIKQLIDKWQKRSRSENVTPEHILGDLMIEVVKTYDNPVQECMASLEQFEMEIFGAGTNKKFRIQNGYYLKRRVSVFKRMLRATLDPLNRVMSEGEADLQPHFQNAKDHLNDVYFYADEISESLASLLNLHLSLASQKTNESSHRTNEVMRVLTVFSCFFLPINFIASIYGMNFEHMPETKWEHGYYLALSMMLIVVIAIFTWFRRKGWLRSRKTL